MLFILTRVCTALYRRFVCVWCVCVSGLCPTARAPRSVELIWLAGHTVHYLAVWQRTRRHLCSHAHKVSPQRAEVTKRPEFRTGVRVCVCPRSGAHGRGDGRQPAWHGPLQLPIHHHRRQQQMPHQHGVGKKNTTEARRDKNPPR